MAVVAGQPFNAFIAGRQARQTEDYANSRNALSQMELQNAPGEMARRNALLDAQVQGAQQNVTQGAANFGREGQERELKQALAEAQHVAQNPTALSQMPPAMQQRAREQLMDRVNDPQAVSQWAGSMVAGIAARLGQGPAAPEAYTLKPGEARFQGSTQVAALPDNPNATDRGFSLSPGQIRYDANGKPIASAPAAPRSPVDLAKIESDLRGEFTTQAKPFVGVAESYQRIRDSVADPSAAGDLALIFNYMKVLDPGSTVREGEFATAQQAGSVPARILAQYNKVLNGERLAPEQRADFFSRATKLYQGQETRFNKMVKERYTTLAKQQGLNPENVVIDVTSSTAPVDMSGGSEPTASGPNGQKLVLRNGQWVPK